MMELEVTIENESGIAGVLSGLRDQIPFATSVAINNTLNAAQDAIRRTLPGHFTLRRPDFIAKTIYIGPKDRARKDRLVGTVRINPERDQLAKFEAGGEKKSSSGHRLAIPIFRESQHDIIIRKNDPLSVARLFQSIEQRKGHVFKGRGKGKKGGPSPINFGRVFLVKNEKGMFILERLRPGRGGNRVLYWFRYTVPIAPDLHFVATAKDTAIAVWSEKAEEAIEYAIATMK